LRLIRVERTLTGALRALGGDGATVASGQPTTSNFTYLRDHWNGGAYKSANWSNHKFFIDVLRPFAKISKE